MVGYLKTWTKHGVHNVNSDLRVVGGTIENTIPVFGLYGGTFGFIVH